MDMDLYKKIVIEAETIPEIGHIILQGLGEPLLDKLLEERFSLIRRLERCVYTNGSLLTPKRFDSLMAAGVDKLIVSLNAVNAEQHEKVMGMKGKYDKIAAICHHIIQNKPEGLDFNIHAVGNGDQFTVEDKNLFFRQWGSKDSGGYGRVVFEGNWAGDNRDLDRVKLTPAIEPIDPASCCLRALTQIYVLYDGTVTTCCFDQVGQMTFGNLGEQTIKEVYNSEKFTQFREDHWNNKADRWEICNHCSRI